MNKYILYTRKTKIIQHPTEVLEHNVSLFIIRPNFVNI